MLKRRKENWNKAINVTYILDPPFTYYFMVHNKENHNTCCDDATGSSNDDW